MRYRFADCLLDTTRHSLSRGGAPVPIEPQVFDLLNLLVGNEGKLVTRDEIVETVWHGRIVSESAISARIAAARKAVGDDGKAQRVIRTVARRGLQLAAEVTVDDDAAPPPPLTPSEPPTVRYARADDGVTLAYCLHGEGAPLVWFGTFPSDQHKNWTKPAERPMIDALASRFRLLRYDQRGSGMSQMALDPRTLESEARDVRAIVDAAGLDRFAIFAESGSSLIAATFAALWPERVTRIAMVGGYVEGRNRRAERPAQSSEVTRRMLEEGWNAPSGAFISAFLSAYFPDGPSEIVRSIAEDFRANAPLESVLLDRDMLNEASIADRLGGITLPVMVLHARDDGIHPLDQARKLTAGLPDAELVVLDTANHVPLPGQPIWDSYLQSLTGFLSRG